MKTLLIFVTTFVLIAGGLKIIIAQTIGKTEELMHHLIFKDNRFEIRHYPEAIAISSSKNGSYSSTSGENFRVLAGYIFGGNEKNQKIAMTAPVRISQDGNENTMRFYMPSDMIYDSMPKPNNPAIHIHKTNNRYTASLEFGGYANDTRIARKTEELKSILEDKGYNYSEDFEFFGYNPPYQLINRRNEIIVELIDFNPTNQNISQKD